MNLSIKDTGRVVDGKHIVEMTQEGKTVLFLKDGENYVEYDESVNDVSLDNPALKIKEIKKHIIQLSKTEALGFHEVYQNGDNAAPHIVYRTIILWSKVRGKWHRSVQRGVSFWITDTPKILEGIRTMNWE